MLRGSEQIVQGAKLETELVSERLCELSVDAGDREALRPRRTMLLRRTVAGGRLSRLVVVILVDQVPEAGSDILVALGGQPIELIRSFLGPIVAWASPGGLVLVSFEALLVLSMDVLQVQVHVIEHLLRRHLEASERFLQVYDLAALSEQELAEGSHLRPCEEDVPVDDWRRSVSEAGDLELLDDIALHIRTGEANWIE